jgi:hypothetical protein
MNDWITKALQTWYKEDNPLHLNPLHPALGLAGESGELLDLYKKNEYKPGFSWWNCVNCGAGDGYHWAENKCPNMDSSYTSLILDELGDYSYYLRILTYQAEIDIPGPYLINTPILRILTRLNHLSGDILVNVVTNSNINNYAVRSTWKCFFNLCHSLQVETEQVFELNYRKLNTEGMHGWESAR